MPDRRALPLSPRRRHLATALGIGALFAASPAGIAAAATTPEPAPRASPRRARPSYDGRAPAGPSAGNVLLWIPRVLLFPVYLVSEYVVRRPLGALTELVEGVDTGATPASDFSFGTGHRSGIVPTLRLDTDFRSTVGAYFYHDRFIVESNAVRVQASFGGTDWLALTVGDRLALGPRSAIALRLDGHRRSDLTFYGLGPRTLAADRSRYGEDRLDGVLSLDAATAHGLSGRSELGLTTVRFRDRTCCHDPGLVAQAARGRFAIPVGFESGYLGLRIGGRLAYDSRAARPAVATGVRVEGSAEVGSELQAEGASGWLRYGGSARGFVDLTGHHHVLSLGGTVLFTDPLGAHDLPFSEQAPLGGTGPMSGFHEGRLLGRSAAAMSLEYRYPIWAFLDASLQLGLGNAFGARLSDLSAGDLRLAGALVVETVGKGTQSVNLLVGAGTETFGQGGHVREARLSLGLTQGF